MEQAIYVKGSIPGSYHKSLFFQFQALQRVIHYIGHVTNYLHTKMSVRFNPCLIPSGLWKWKFSAVQQEQLRSKMFTFTCAFVHCFLSGYKMFS